MAYAAQADMERLFGADEVTELSDRDNDDTNDPGVVDGALADASDLIDSYLAVRYTTPVTSVSESLKVACCKLARYDLHKDAATDQVAEDRKSVIAWLKDLAAGRAVLVDAGGEPDPTGAPSGQVKYASNDRVFTDETLAGF